MYQIIQSFVNFSGDWSTSYNGYVVQGCVALAILSIVILLDFIYKIFLSVIARRDK